MVISAHTPKGSLTRATLLEHGYQMACARGFEGLSLGAVAEEAGMSKSGVFSHFGSLQELQLSVLKLAGESFWAQVITASLSASRGEPRLRQIMIHWFDWVAAHIDGCPLQGAFSEYGAKPGPHRDLLFDMFNQWRRAMARSASMGIEVGHFAPGSDPKAFSFELVGIALAVHQDARLIGIGPARKQGDAAVERLLASYGI